MDQNRFIEAHAVAVNKSEGAEAGFQNATLIITHIVRNLMNTIPGAGYILRIATVDPGEAHFDTVPAQMLIATLAISTVAAGNSGFDNNSVANTAIYNILSSFGNNAADLMSYDKRRIAECSPDNLQICRTNARRHYLYHHPAQPAGRLRVVPMKLQVIQAFKYYRFHNDASTLYLLIVSQSSSKPMPGLSGICTMPLTALIGSFTRFRLRTVS